jgi:hypothetical protein
LESRALPQVTRQQLTGALDALTQRQL